MTFATLLMMIQTIAAGGPPAAPFAVGEQLEYGGRRGFVPLGKAVLSVDAVESVRGAPHWKFSFTSSVSVPFFKNTTTLASWTGVSDFISRRFLKDIEENGKRKVEDFRIHPDSGFFRRGTDPVTKPTSEAPLDDVAFFYFVRTVPLEVGKTYSFDNYYRPERNPVTVRVVKRETMELPDGTKVPCLVLHPIVDEPNGMFSRRSEARLWLTDDARRIPVQIQSNYSFGQVKLVLEKITLGGTG